MNRGAFSLTELLIVTAILGILVAIIFPIYNRARVQAHVTDDIAKLKQLGAANAIYSAENDGRIQISAGPLLDKYESLFTSKLDPTKEGLWNFIAADFGYKTRGYSGNRVSFIALGDMFRVGLNPDEFAELQGNPGWLIAFSPLEFFNAASANSIFEGSFLRLTMEGSVIRKPSQRYNGATGYIWYFRDHTDQEKQATLDE